MYDLYRFHRTLGCVRTDSTYDYVSGVLAGTLELRHRGRKQGNIVVGPGRIPRPSPTRRTDLTGRGILNQACVPSLDAMLTSHESSLNICYNPARHRGLSGTLWRHEVLFLFAINEQRFLRENLFTSTAVLFQSETILPQSALFANSNRDLPIACRSGLG